MKQNRYFFIYSSIIDRAKTRQGLTSFENHHIIPRCMGGSDDSDNIVSLTIREHFICHKLLPKFTDGDAKRKLEHAFSYMVLTKDTIRPDYRVTSHDYELARIYASKSRPQSWRENISKALKGRKKSEKDYLAMLERTQSPEARLNISLKMKGRKPPQTTVDKITKTYRIDFADKPSITITNLRKFCRESGYDYQSMYINSTHDRIMKRGIYRGIKVTQVNTSTS